MTPISKGAGITAGLNIVRVKGKFLLEDCSTDGRFADDVREWAAAAGLNPRPTKKTKDAKKQDTKTPRSTDTHA